ncbi:zinc finger protein 84-like [Scomber japonicus]|uniref:zinc finger protein 84-like n=1 Tax=Scomber japonicus TaxID=13676 RepID=UPI002305E8E3|nr:zinc finger protein 84-like [Scomber japonicus]
MSRFQELKDLFKRRLINAARAHLFEHFEESISGVEKKIDHKRKLLDLVLYPDVKLQRTESPADVQQLLETREEVPSSSQDHQHPDPSHIKEEHEEVWTSQEGEQLQGLEEVDITKFISTPVPVKSEDDEEKPQSSHLHQRLTEEIKTEADGEDCGGSEPDRNSHPDTHLLPDTDDKTSDSSKLDTDGSDFWKETRQHPSVSDSHVRCKTDRGRLNPSENDKAFTERESLSQYMALHTEVKREDPDPPHIKEEQEEVWTSQEGGQLQGLEEADITKFILTPVPVKSEDDEEKPQSSHLHQRLTEQMETEADGEDCGGSEPDRNSHPDTHLLPDTDDKTPDSSEPDGSDFICSVCNNRFRSKSLFRYHRCDPESTQNHPCEEPKKRFCECPDCGKKFRYNSHLIEHQRTHTGEQPFNCSDCEHMTHHTRPEENPFCCSDCGEGYRWQYQLKIHECPSKSSQQSKTDFKKNDCGEAQQSRTLDPERHSKPDTDKKSLVSSDTNGSTDISFWKETIDEGCQTDKKSFTPTPIKSEDDEKKRLNPSENDKAFTERQSLSQYMALHTEVKREDPDPPHIKEEQEEVWTSQEGDQLQGLEEVDITKFILTPVPVKSEDDEEKPQSSHLHQRLTEEIKTEADGEDCGGSEPDRNSHPDTHLLPDTDDKTLDSSEPESDDSDFWTPIRKSHV